MNKKSLTFTIGSIFATALTTASIAHSDSNPFGMKEISQATVVAEADKAKEGKCGEGKCGAEKAKAATEKAAEGKCGAKGEEKMKEASCGASKGADKMKEGSCGGEKK
ncbi:hypothetical protein JCM14076_23380 [Methylosoma difficile]